MGFLKIIKDYILVLRPFNLFIIIITQYFIQFYFIVPRAQTITLEGILFPLFVLDTAIIAASGYLINDIIDQSTDEINKPEQRYVGVTIPEFVGYLYYLVLLIFGAMLSVYIAFKTDLWKYIWIYPAGIWAMYLYSRYLKGTILLGNIFVSLFIAGVIGMLGFAQFLSGFTLHTDIKEFIIAYMIFIFILNLIREIIKDVEDADGDTRTGKMTFVVKYGIAATKILLIFLVILALGGLIFWLIYSSIPTSNLYKIWMVACIVVPLIITGLIIFKALSKKVFKELSLLIKIILIAGLISLIFIT